MANSVYKLTYFNVRARAEPIRFLFAVAGVPYQDIRISKDQDWPSFKGTTPWGKVPILEVDGQTLAESVAICRYLARTFKLTGGNEFEAAKCDEYVDAIMDLRSHWRSYFWESDEAKKATLKKVFLEGQVPNYFAKFEKILEQNGGGEFLLGAKYTWADLFIAHTLAFFEETVDPGTITKAEGGPYPKILKFKEAVFNIPEIKKWVEERPKTNM